VFLLKSAPSRIIWASGLFQQTPGPAFVPLLARGQVAKVDFGWEQADGLHNARPIEIEQDDGTSTIGGLNGRR